jgi:hypothetical protein
MNVRIGARIYIGFIAIIVITLSAIACSVYSQNIISDQNAASHDLEEEARKILTINIQASKLTGAAEQYRLFPKLEQTAAMEQARTAIEQEAQQRTSAVLAEGRRRIYAQMYQLAQAMRPDLERLAMGAKSLSEARAHG